MAQKRGREEGGGQNLVSQVERVNVAFKKHVHKILEKIKHEPYFHYLGKMSGDPARRNQNLYYTYHWDKGHTTK